MKPAWVCCEACGATLDASRVFAAGERAALAKLRAWVRREDGRIALARVPVDVGTRAVPALDERPACSMRSMSMLRGDGPCEACDDDGTQRCRWCGGRM